MVYSFSRPKSRPSEWRLEEHVLSTRSPELAKEWAGHVNQAVMLDQERCVEQGGRGSGAGRCRRVRAVSGPEGEGRTTAVSFKDGSM